MLLHSAIALALCIVLGLVTPGLSTTHNYMPSELGRGFGFPFPPHNKRRAKEVRNAFRGLWLSYRDNAYPHDTMKPLDRKPYMDDCWRLSAVESLGTAIIMGEKATVQNLLQRLRMLDFEKTYSMNQLVDVSVATSRYLGALLSGPLPPTPDTAPPPPPPTTPQTHTTPPPTPHTPPTHPPHPTPTLPTTAQPKRDPQTRP
ncbi:hypothetical protein AK830_g10633, partial [Neonectria ditissima]